MQVVLPLDHHSYYNFLVSMTVQALSLPCGVIEVLQQVLSFCKAELKNFSSGFPTTSAFTSAEYSKPVTKQPEPSWWLGQCYKS